MSASSGSSENLQCHGTASQDSSQFHSQSGGCDTSCSETSLDTVASHKSRETHGVRFNPEVCHHPPSPHDHSSKHSKSKSGKKKHKSSHKKKSSKALDVEIVKPLCRQVLDNARVATPSVSRRGSARTCRTHSEGSLSICDRRRYHCPEHQILPDDHSSSPYPYAPPELQQVSPFVHSDPVAFAPLPDQYPAYSSAELCKQTDAPGTQPTNTACPPPSGMQNTSSPNVVSYSNNNGPISGLLDTSPIDCNTCNISSSKDPLYPAEQIQKDLSPRCEETPSDDPCSTQQLLAPPCNKPCTKPPSDCSADPLKTLPSDDPSSSPAPEDYSDARQEMSPLCDKPPTKFPSDRRDDPCSKPATDDFCDALEEILPPCDPFTKQPPSTVGPLETSPSRDPGSNAPVDDCRDAQQEMSSRHKSSSHHQSSSHHKSSSHHQSRSKAPLCDSSACPQEKPPCINPSNSPAPDHYCNAQQEISPLSVEEISPCEDPCNKPPRSDSCATSHIAPLISPSCGYPYYTTTSNHFYGSQQPPPQAHNPYFSPQSNDHYAASTQHTPPSSNSLPYYASLQASDPSNATQKNQVTLSAQPINDSFKPYDTRQQRAPIRKDTSCSSSLRSSSSTDSEDKPGRSSDCEDSYFEPTASDSCDYLQSKPKKDSLCKDFHNNPPRYESCDDPQPRKEPCSDDPCRKPARDDLCEDSTWKQEPYPLFKDSKTERNDCRENPQWKQESYCPGNSLSNKTPSCDPCCPQHHSAHCGKVSSCSSILHSIQGDISGFTGQTVPNAEPRGHPCEGHTSLQQCASHHSHVCCGATKDTSQNAQCKPGSPHPFHEQSLNAPQNDNFKEVSPQQVFQDNRSPLAAQNAQDFSFPTNQQQHHSSCKSAKQYVTTSHQHSPADSCQAFKQRSSFSLDDPYYSLSPTGLSRVSIKERSSSPVLDPSYYFHRCTGTHASRAAQGKENCSCMSRPPASRAPQDLFFPQDPVNQQLRSCGMSPQNYPQATMYASQEASALPDYSCSSVTEAQGKPKDNYPHLSSCSNEAAPYRNTSQCSMSHTVQKEELAQSFVSCSREPHHCQAIPPTFQKSGLFDPPCNLSQTTNESAFTKSGMNVSCETAAGTNVSYGRSQPQQESSFVDPNYRSAENGIYNGMSHSHTDFAALRDPRGFTSHADVYNRQEMSYESSPYYPLAASAYYVLNSRQESAFAAPSQNVPQNNMSGLSPLTKQEEPARDVLYAPTQISPQQCPVALAMSKHHDHSSCLSLVEVLPASESNSYHCRTCGATSPTPKQEMRDPDSCSTSSHFRPTSPHTHIGSCVPDYCLSQPSSFPANVAPVKQAGVCIPAWCFSPSTIPSNYRSNETSSTERSVAPENSYPTSQPNNYAANKQELSMPEDSCSVHEHCRSCSPSANQERPATCPMSHSNCNSSILAPEQQNLDSEDSHSVAHSETCPHNSHSSKQVTCVHNWNNALSVPGGRVQPVQDIPVCSAASRQEHAHHVRPPDCILFAPSVSKEGLADSKDNSEERTVNHESPPVFLKAESPTQGRECQPSPSFEQYPLFSWSPEENYFRIIGQMSCVSLSPHCRQCCASCNTDLTGFCQRPCSPSHHTPSCNSPVHQSPADYSVPSYNSPARAYGNGHFSPYGHNQNDGATTRQGPCRSTSSRSNTRLYAQQPYTRSLRRPNFFRSRVPEKPKPYSSSRGPSRKRIHNQAPPCGPEDSMQTLPSRLTQDTREFVSSCASSKHISEQSGAKTFYSLPLLGAQNSKQNKHQVEDSSIKRGEKSAIDEKYQECSGETSEGLPFLLSSWDEEKGEDTFKVFTKQTPCDNLGLQHLKCESFHQSKSAASTQGDEIQPCLQKLETAPSTPQAISGKEILELKNSEDRLISDASVYNKKETSGMGYGKAAENTTRSCGNVGVPRGFHPKKLPPTMSKSHVSIDIQPNKGYVYLGESAKTLWRESGKDGLSNNFKGEAGNAEYQHPGIAKRGVSEFQSPKRIRSPKGTHSKASAIPKQAQSQKTSTIASSLNHTEPVVNPQAPINVPPSQMPRGLTPDPMKVTPKNSSSHTLSSVKVMFSDGIQQERFHPCESSSQKVNSLVKPVFIDTCQRSANAKGISRDDPTQATTQGSEKSYSVQPGGIQQMSTHSSLVDERHEEDTQKYQVNVDSVKDSFLDTLTQPDKLLLEERTRHPREAIIQLSHRRYNVSSKNAETQYRYQKYQKALSNRREPNFLGSCVCSQKLSQRPFIGTTRSRKQSPVNVQIKTGMIDHPSEERMVKQDSERSPSNSTQNRVCKNSVRQTSDHIQFKGDVAEVAQTRKQSSEANLISKGSKAEEGQGCLGAYISSQYDQQGALSSQSTGTERQPSQVSDKKVTVQITEPGDGWKPVKKVLVRTLTPHPCSGRDLRYSSDGESEYLQDPEPDPAENNYQEPPSLHSIHDKRDMKSPTLELNFSKITAPLEMIKSRSSLPNEIRRACLGEAGVDNVRNPALQPKTISSDLALTKTIVKSLSSKTLESEKNIQDYFPYHSKEYLSAFHAVVPSHKLKPLPVHKDFSAPNVSFSEPPYPLNPVMSYPAECVAASRRSSCPNIQASHSPSNQTTMTDKWSTGTDFKSTQTDCTCPNFYQSSITSNLDQPSASGYSCGSQTQSFQHRHHRKVYDIRPLLFSPLCPSHSGVFMLWSHPEFHDLTGPCPYWDCSKSYCHHHDFNRYACNPHAEYYGSRHRGYPAPFSEAAAPHIPNHFPNHRSDRTREDMKRWKVSELRDSTISPSSTTQHSPRSSNENNGIKKVRKKKVLWKKGK